MQTGYAYDALGRLTAYTDGNGGVTAYNYDNRGNRISVTTPEGITELYGYDAVGNLLSLTNGEGETWHCTYDNLYRLVRQISPLGSIFSDLTQMRSQSSKRQQSACGGCG